MTETCPDNADYAPFRGNGLYNALEIFMS